MQISPVASVCVESAVGRVLRGGQNLGLAALVLAFGCNTLQTAGANGDTRTLSFHHTHTNEDLTITYKRDGRYDDEALKKINWVLRDWRRNEAVRMDPHVLDAVWELYRDVGATQPIEIICGYRAPATNNMLRQRSSGVARFSQHTLGKAIDLHIPGVSLETQRAAAMRLQRGGVGYYPSSTFIHVDVGSIRHWPRMSYDQLARVFPNGRTVHVPSNGRPLAGYQLALADISKRGSTPSQTSLEAARAAGVNTAAANQRPNLLASLAGAAKEPEEDEDASRPARRSPKPAASPAAKTAAAPTPKREPAAETARADSSHRPDTNKPIRTASAEAMVPNQSVALPNPGGMEAPADHTADAMPWPLRREAQADRVPIELALAYAAEPVQRGGPSLARAATLGTAVDRGRTASEAAERPADKDSVRVVKKTYARLSTDTDATVPSMSLRTTVSVTAGMQFDDPWLRAAMFAPSLHTSLTTSFFGEPDIAAVRPLMEKPAATVVMTFSEDPLNGLTCERFRGGAVLFLPTVTFARTASLQLK